MDLPDSFLPHTVTVRALVGASGMGRAYAAPVTVPAAVEDVREVVTDSGGADVVSDTRVYVRPTVHAPVGSLVTVWAGTADEREAKVVAARHHDRPDNWAVRVLFLV